MFVLLFATRPGVKYIRVCQGQLIRLERSSPTDIFNHRHQQWTEPSWHMSHMESSPHAARLGAGGQILLHVGILSLQLKVEWLAVWTNYTAMEGGWKNNKAGPRHVFLWNTSVIQWPNRCNVSSVSPRLPYSGAITQSSGWQFYNWQLRAYPKAISLVHGPPHWYCVHSVLLYKVTHGCKSSPSRKVTDMWYWHVQIHCPICSSPWRLIDLFQPHMSFGS